MHVLRNMVEGVGPGGIVLDLQGIRPDPVVEIDGRAFCEIDRDWLSSGGLASSRRRSPA